VYTNRIYLLLLHHTPYLHNPYACAVILYSCLHTLSCCIVTLFYSVLATMRNLLRPLIIFILLYPLTSAAQRLKCYPSLGTDIDAEECTKAFDTLPDQSLSVRQYNTRRVFMRTTRHIDDQAMPRQAILGTCKVTLDFENNSHAKTSWASLAVHTAYLARQCAGKNRRMGGKYVIDGFIIRISSTRKSRAVAGAAEVSAPASLGPVAHSRSILPLTGQNLAGAGAVPIPKSVDLQHAAGELFFSPPAKKSRPEIPSGPPVQRAPALLAASHVALAAPRQDFHEASSSERFMATLPEPPQWGSKKSRTTRDWIRPAYNSE